MSAPHPFPTTTAMPASANALLDAIAHRPTNSTFGTATPPADASASRLTFVRQTNTSMPAPDHVIAKKLHVCPDMSKTQATASAKKGPDCYTTS